MRTTVADFIAETLYEAGVQEAFMVTGGFSMALTDAVGRQGKIKPVCCHHEQAATMAGEAAGRYKGNLGAVFVTAGPAATNTLTGVVGAWVDNGPVIVIAGQAKLRQAKVTGLRQFPVQGFETLPIFERVTKYAVMLEELNMVRYHLQKALYLANHGRQGPVWIEVPNDLQGAPFDPEGTPTFDPVAEGYETLRTASAELDRQIETVATMIAQARRPLFLAGAGVRAAGALEALEKVVHRLRVPLVCSRLGMDLVGHDDPCFVGRPGTYGDRPANTAVQNSDVLISVGSRLALGLTGHDWEDFAPEARKVVVDVDAAELHKPSITPEVAVLADAKLFLERLDAELERRGYQPHHDDWLALTQDWKERYPVDLPEYADETEGINSYHFTRVFSEHLGPDTVAILDTGSCFHVWAQAFKVKKGQRHIITGGLSTMGYGLPAAVGVAAASGREVLCVTGDGSIQMNLQELQTIVHHQFPIKILCFDNDGYLLIRLSQKNFAGGRLHGESPRTGVSFPDPEKVAAAYGLHFVRIDSADRMEAGIQEMMRHPGPVWCNVKCPAWQILGPRVASEKLPDGSMRSLPFDDMFPFLPRDEYERNCVRKHGKLQVQV